MENDVPVTISDGAKSAEHGSELGDVARGLADVLGELLPVFAADKHDSNPRWTRITGTGAVRIREHSSRSLLSRHLANPYRVGPTVNPTDHAAANGTRTSQPVKPLAGVAVGTQRSHRRPPRAHRHRVRRSCEETRPTE